VIQRHPDRFDEPFEISMDNPSPVRMSVDPGEVMLTPGGTATVAIRFRMARGWHVNTNDPGDEYAVPLAIVAVGGGVTAEPSFPAGRTMSVAGESVRVFGDSVVIPVTLRADANASGSVKLLVTWQACTEQECQMPETTEAPCTITVR
jgi:DsbC/DsbD-like thiol-disulfide interchange protein